MKANLTTHHFEVFFKKEMKVIKLAMKSFAKDKNPEHLHSLRVSIKKIRAISGILSHNKPAFNKIIKQLKSLFQETGVIRNMQINSLILKEYELHRSKAYIRLLKNIAESVSFFNKRIHQHLQSVNEIEKQLLSKNKNLKQKHLQLFLQKEELRLTKLIRQKNNSNEHLHDIRKQLKKLVYINKFLPEENKHALHLNYKNTSELQEVIGTWHDHIMALEIIEKDFPKQKLLLSKLQHQIKSEYQSCKQTLKKEFLH
jgi:CHAD domain-containing protein